MGCFSYICSCCGKNIRIGEKCVLIHIRDGKELGRTEGHYNGYGGVEEDPVYRGEDGVNSHQSICTSEFGLPSSYRFGRMRVLPDGRLLDSDVISSFVKEYILSHTLDVIATGMKIPSAEEMKRKSFTEARLCFSTSSKPVSDETIAMVAAHRLQERLSLEIEKDGERVDIAHEWALSLPKWEGATSGIVATHSFCYHSIKDPQKLPFSDPDPYQAGGLARKKYV